MRSINNFLTTQSKKVLAITLIASILLMAIHVLGIKYSLYFELFWYDILAHALAGFILGFFLGYLFFYKTKLVLATSFVITILWELYEIFISKILIVSIFSYTYDTITDIVIALVVAYFSISLSRRFK